MNVIGYAQLRLFKVDDEIRKFIKYFLRELNLVDIQFDSDKERNMIEVNGIDYLLINCFLEGEGKRETIKVTVRKDDSSKEEVLDLVVDIVDYCDCNASLYILNLITESKEYTKIPHIVSNLENSLDINKL